MNTNSVIEEILKGLLDALGVAYKGISRSEIAGQNIFSIQIDDGRALIGTRGDTLHAIDSLVKKIAEKQLFVASGAEGEVAKEAASSANPLYFLVDVNDYRSKQIQDLQNKAIMMAERARSLQYDVELAPMSSYERLIIHTALSEESNIKTESQGEGRNRRVVIRYVVGESASVL